MAEARRKDERLAQRTRAIVERVISPLLESGAARDETLEGDDPREIELRVLPTRVGAAEIWICPMGGWVHVAAGRGDMEITVDSRDEWEEVLEECIRAVCAGGYRETCTDGALGKTLLMTFVVPGGEDITYTRIGIGGEAGRGLQVGEIRYPPYEEPQTR